MPQCVQDVRDSRKLLSLYLCVIGLTFTCITTVLYLYWPTVAFSGALGTDTGQNFTLGPYRRKHVLIYKEVYTNVGGAYNVSTGVFTVPLRGVYRFFFTSFGWGKRTGVVLYHDDDHVLGSYDNSPVEGRTTTNLVNLQLEAGARMYVGLSAGREIHVSTGHLNIFYALLVFTV